MKRAGGEELLHELSAKKPDCENTDTFFKTIELVNDSLVSEASPTEKSGIGDTKQTKVKSPLVQYPIDSIPSYEGSIGSSTTVSLTRACVSCIPDATVFLSDEDGKGVLSTEKQRMSTTKQKETHTPKLQGISTLSHTTSSSPPLDPDAALLLVFDPSLTSQWTPYRQRNLAHLQAAEPRSHVTKILRKSHRAKLLDWLAEVSHEFHVRTETSVLAFLLVDKFLETRELPRDRLQCLGAAALLLAAKFCDDTHPSLETLSSLSLRCFSVQQLVDMEMELFREFHFNVRFVTAFDFLLAKLAAISVTPLVLFRALFFLESLLVEGSLATETPSRVATVALEAARDEEGKEVAMRSVEQLARSGLTAVSRKYGDAAHLYVASL
ncbi:hypothetical protein WA538_003337, partial [Blastocystis sp. DL]